MRLSPHFSLKELTASDTAARLGIDNTPSEAQIVLLGKLAARLEDVRAITGPLQVTSGYRCLALNRAIGSKDTSQHVKCQAADVKSLAGLSARDLARKVADSDIKFDQCILEFNSWLHISFTDFPRRQVLTIDRAGTRQGIG
jgi:zinc D-Ala-D-Ala carboxypeptidase